MKEIIGRAAGFCIHANGDIHVSDPFWFWVIVFSSCLLLTGISITAYEYAKYN